MRLDALPDKKFTGKIKSMSGTASSNMFSADPAKKFDVIFSIDMRQLLSALGANEAAVTRILAQADANRKKGPMFNASAGPSPEMIAAMQQGGGMAMAGGGPPPPGAPPAGAAQGQQRQRGAGGGGNQDPEAARKRRELVTKFSNGKSMADMTAEERSEVMAKVNAELAKTGQAPPARGNRGPGGAPPGMPQMFNVGGFMVSQKDLDNANLPPAPEQDNQLDVLLRPGLLADVEIIVDKVQNAINVPIQAVFEKEGKQVVYVKMPNNRFESREVKPLKRSENVMIISSGVKPGETIAMANPEAKPGDKKKDQQKGGGAASALPGGKGGM